MRLITPTVYHIRKKFISYDEMRKDWVIKSICGRYMLEGDIPLLDPCGLCQVYFERDYEMCTNSDEYSHKKSERDKCDCQEEK